MTMKQRGNGDDEPINTFTIDVEQEVYLRNRDEPVRVNTTFELLKESIDKDEPVVSVMNFATHHLLNTIDVVKEHRYMLSDSRHNKFIFLTDQIQAVSILAPDEKTISAALEA